MKVLNFIVCDDIRHEIGNKITLVGIYTDSIKVQLPPEKKKLWPILLPKMGIFAQLQLEQGEVLPASVTLVIRLDGSDIAKFEALLSQEFHGKHKDINLAIIASPFPLPAPGRLSFCLTLKHGEKTFQDLLPYELVVEQNLTLKKKVEKSSEEG